MCTQPYHDMELLVKCSECDRTLHGGCDQIRTDDEADFVVDDGRYVCILCRERGSKYGPKHQQLLEFRKAHGLGVPFPATWRSESVDGCLGDKTVGINSAGSLAARSDDEQDPSDPTLVSFLKSTRLVNFSKLTFILSSPLGSSTCMELC